MRRRGLRRPHRMHRKLRMWMMRCASAGRCDRAGRRAHRRSVRWLQMVRRARPSDSLALVKTCLGPRVRAYVL